MHGSEAYIRIAQRLKTKHSGARNLKQKQKKLETLSKPGSIQGEGNRGNDSKTPP